VHPGWDLRYTPERLTASAEISARTRLGTLRSSKSVEDRRVSGARPRLRLTALPDAPDEESLPALLSEFQAELAPGTLFPPADSEEGRKQQAEGSPDTRYPMPDTRNLSVEIAGNTLRTLLGLDTLRSTLFTVRRTEDGSFLIEGRGWGHGRGLCQAGAKALAAPPIGYDYRAILLHYYAGASPHVHLFPGRRRGKQGIGSGIGTGKSGEKGTGSREQRAAVRRQKSVQQYRPPTIRTPLPATRYPVPGDTPWPLTRTSRRRSWRRCGGAVGPSCACRAAACTRSSQRDARRSAAGRLRRTAPRDLVVFYDGRGIVCHRLLRKEHRLCHLKGDTNLWADPPVVWSQVLGRVRRVVDNDFRIHAIDTPRHRRRAALLARFSYFYALYFHLLHALGHCRWWSRGIEWTE
jgi:hypothetical protein